MQDTLIGTIERFLFQNHENGYAVFVLRSMNHETTTVCGSLPALVCGQEVELRGAWVLHKRFGKQFEAQACIRKLPETITGIKKFLGSGLIKGIGEVYAQKLVDHFGVETLTILDRFPERLSEISGIGKKRIETMCAAWREHKDVANLLVFLQDKGVGIGCAGRIYKQYKQDSLKIIQENPYRLADEVWGIGFKTADMIAQKLGFSLTCLPRIKAGIVFTITSVCQRGHLYVEIGELQEYTKKLLGFTDEHTDLVKQALQELYEKEKVYSLDRDDKKYITVPSHYFSEKGVASKINDIFKTPPDVYFDSDKVYSVLRVETPGEIYLNVQQQEGILSCLTHKITVITGGPGTGKTTLIKKLLSFLEAAHVTYKLAAPTGRAAKRIIEGTGRFALTLHRLLNFDVGTMSFTYNERNALPVQVLIIDEASMIDIFLAHALLKAVPYGTRLVFIGDIDQLPSVGPGNFLQDIMTSKQVSCVRLTHIFRQAQDSLIVMNAHKINRGEFPVSFLPEARKDFKFIKEERYEAVEDHIKQIFARDIASQGISADNTMVLTPMNRGPIGTIALNNFLQKLLNPQERAEIAHAGTIFKQGDKVMQIRNNYDKQVFNGDIGLVEQIDHEQRQMMVNFNEHQRVVYEFDELNELVLSYAISIHKSQGSEYDAVIIPLFVQHFMLLQRNLIYTALTRAKKMAIFIGQPRALAIALRTTRGTARLTFLSQFLGEQ